MRRGYSVLNCNLSRMVACVALLLSVVAKTKSQIPNQSKPMPPGTLVDVGGYRVHLYCMGQGSPTVMIVGAAFSFDWGLVQPEVAKFSRVCTFDPSGTAWSDPFHPAIDSSSSIGTKPASTPDSVPKCSDRVDEIHRLLTKTPIDGPYILVGFSVGALWERLYAATYPDGITGMVIVDHAFLPSGGNNPPPHTSDTTGSRPRYSPPVLISKAPIVIGFEDDSNFSKLPERDQRFHMWALSQDPLRPNREMAVDCFSRLQGVNGARSYPLGNMDLIVISTRNEAPDYMKLQANLLAQSRRSKHVIATNSTHMVPIDQPEVIISAIRELVESTRKQGVESNTP